VRERRTEYAALAVERMPTGVCSACAEAVRFDPRALVTMGFIDDSEAAA